MAFTLILKNFIIESRMKITFANNGYNSAWC